MEWNSMLEKVIEGATEKVYKISNTSFIKLGPASNFNLSFIPKT
jgi:hypothetical protein